MLPPPELPIRLDRDALVRDGGRTLAGGLPFTVMSLSPLGAQRVREWTRGAPVGEPAAVRKLAQRLLMGGIAVPEPGPREPEPAEVEVVVPAYGRPERLAACLAALAVAPVPITVIDDGSPDPAVIAAVAARHGAKLLALPSNRGPAAARNAGMRATRAPLVAFVDSDVVVDPGWLELLLPHFDDPGVAAATPRVVALQQRDAPGLTRYEARHSSLDMGPHSRWVGPGSRVPYVPGTALVIRRDGVPPFDETLRFGEDVDLCWRIRAAGRRIVYDSRSTVGHAHRVDLYEFVVTRWRYGSSIGPLATRHPEALAPVRANAATFAAVSCAATGSLPAGAALAMWRTWALYRELDGRPALAVELARLDLAATARALGRAARRAWLPALFPAAARRSRWRRLLVLALVMRLLEDDRPSIGDLPYAMLDDAVAAFATWSACARSRTFAPLLPRLTRRRPRGVCASRGDHLRSRVITSCSAGEEPR